LRNNAGIYAVHRLVQTVVKDSMTRDVQKEWAEHTVRVIHHIFPMPETENWSRCEQYLPHALACACHIEQWHVTLLEAAELLNRIGNYLWQRAQYTQAATLCEQALALTEQKAEQYYQDALQIYKKTLGPVHHLIAGTLKNFGELYSEEEECEQAESYYVQALTILEQSLGSNHPTVASYLDDYAPLLEKTGRKDRARRLRKRAQCIRIDNKNG
jgi:tetratricopeptide (TPR) repeat protein